MSIKSENDFLKLIDKYFINQLAPQHRGDDCAILLREEFCVSSDIFLEDVHFKREYFPAEAIGYKALAVNISDILAMGAKPHSFQLNIVCPKNISTEYFESIFSSMARLAKEQDIYLQGGDTSSGDKLLFAITIFGTKKESFLYRKESKVNDILILAGDIGLSKTALSLFQNKKSLSKYPKALKSHLYPELQTNASNLLANTHHIDNMRGVHALMDVSDGLLKDIPRLLKDNQKAILTDIHKYIPQEVSLFIKESFPHLSPVSQERKALEWILQGGEDYALLASVSAIAWQELQKHLYFYAIGEVQERKEHEPQIIVPNLSLEKIASFDHFE